MQRLLIVLMLLLTTLLAACGAPTPTTQPASTDSTGSTAGAASTSGEPEHITVQHILIGFTGSLPGKTLTRTQAEAQTLAEDVFNQAKTGSDFDALVVKYTDDQAPGIYSMSNSGVTPVGDEYSRDNMVGAFGNVGFKLAVGEIGLAPFDKTVSPYGWHIIKRLK